VGYNGIGPEYRSRDPGELEIQTRLGLPARYVFHVSRFSLRKNPWTLLRAFAELVKNSGYPGALVCAGSGWDVAEVREKARAWGIADRLRTPGFVTDDEVAQLMAGAELFVFPSLAEGFGMPNVEAMASGCPVVTSGAFAIPEIVGDAALIVADPLDVSGFAVAMARVLADQELADTLRRRGLARRPLYSWDDAADKLLALYERVLTDV
jgi:glycosyltransferase involved in cell wall biosynthesis